MQLYFFGHHLIQFVLTIVFVIYAKYVAVVKYHKWAFDDIYTSFEKAGKSLNEADQKLASGIMDCKKYI